MTIITLSKLFPALIVDLADWKRKGKIIGKTGAWKKRDMEGPVVRL